MDDTDQIGQTDNEESEEQGAQQRARILLTDVLTAAEHEQLERDGYLRIHSRTAPHRVYHIPHQQGFVRMYESGQPVTDLCLQPTISLPADDLVIMHKVLIEGDEQLYLTLANHMGVLPVDPPTIENILDWLYFEVVTPSRGRQRRKTNQTRRPRRSSQDSNALP